MKPDKSIDEIPLGKYIENPKINKTLTIGICVRNCQKYLKSNFIKLNEISNLFKKTHIVIYENGSSDASLEMLRKFAEENKHLILIHEDYQIDKYHRTVRLARGRNICLNIAKKINNDIYIVMDFDDVIKKLDYKNVESSFNQKFNWGGLFGNQKGKYYDIWALRTFGAWLDYDYHHIYDYLTQDISNSIIKGIYHKIIISSKNRNVPKDSIIKVKSAFGGIGIYKLSNIGDSYYYGWKNNKESCEHVHFNLQINKNSDLYIIGNLITY